MSNPERLTLYRREHPKEELAVTIFDEGMDTPRACAVPSERDVAQVLCNASPEWFNRLLLEMHAFSNGGRSVALADLLADVAGGDIDPGFGVDPEDSARLLELRNAIDEEFGWANETDRERGDYIARVQEIGSALYRLVNRVPERSAGTREALDAGLESARKNMAAGGSGGLPLVDDRVSLTAQVVKLQSQIRTQRAELRRFNREARARKEGATIAITLTQVSLPESDS